MAIRQTWGALSQASELAKAVKDVGPDVAVNAVAPDGVIEGIEHGGYRFCLGVQWHPEYAISAGDEAIFRAFVEAAGAGS